MYKVDGFIFEDEASAELARKEEEGVRFIKERTALDNPEVVLKLYVKLIEQQLFVTPVGVRFLSELQSFLYSVPELPKEKIPEIKIVTPVKKENTQPKAPDKHKYKRPFYVALFFAIVFGVSVVGMFLITEISGNNVNIINYRNEIINQYESWEEELKTEEQRLKTWEKELEEREAALKESTTQNTR